MILLLIGVLIFSVTPSYSQTTSSTTTSHDSKTDRTTVRSASLLLDAKDPFHRLKFSLEYSYSGKTASTPDRINFNLTTIVKARKLNSDLYVVFLVDGKAIHFSSNRSAIPRPVPGRRWVGERMDFLIPTEEFVKLANCKKLALELGGVEIELNEDARKVIAEFASLY